MSAVLFPGIDSHDLAQKPDGLVFGALERVPADDRTETAALVYSPDILVERVFTDL